MNVKTLSQKTKERYIVKKDALSNFDNQIFTNIAKDLEVSEAEVEDVVQLMFYSLKETMKRGMNFDLPFMNGKVNKKYGIIHKQRIGDQKEIIDCIRYGRLISEQRMQTDLIIKKIKKQLT